MPYNRYFWLTKLTWLVYLPKNRHEMQVVWPSQNRAEGTCGYMQKCWFYSVKTDIFWYNHFVAQYVGSKISQAQLAAWDIFEATYWATKWGIICTLWNKSFNSKKIQPNLIQSKMIPIEWEDLNSKLNLQFVIGLGK